MYCPLWRLAVVLLLAAVLHCSAQYNIPQQQSYRNQGQQPYGYGQMPINYQQQGFQQNQNARSSVSMPSHLINNPVITSNTTIGAIVTVQLVSYSNPSGSLPGGLTCACPTGKNCAFILSSAPTCFFSFTIVMSAPDQSVQIVRSEFVPFADGLLSGGNWNKSHTLNMTAKPMAIDVFVDHLGVVIDSTTAQLEFYNYLAQVDTFVTSLKTYVPTQEGGTVTLKDDSPIGKVQNTRLSLKFSVQCIGGKVGDDCDLVCSPSSSDPSRAVCVSSITQMQSSCLYSGTQQVTDCRQCANGLNANQTACATADRLTTNNVGVSSAYRTWTIVLGVLLGIAIIFIVVLIIVYMIVRNREAARRTPVQRYTTSGYSAQATRPLIQKEDEWNPETKVNAVTNVHRPPPTDNETSAASEESFGRSSGGAALARREAQV